MGNSLLGMLSQGENSNNIFQMAMKFANGKLNINDVIGNNPKAKEAWDQTQKMIQQNGNPENIFKQLCKQKGIDFDQVKQMFK